MSLPSSETPGSRITFKSLQDLTLFPSSPAMLNVPGHLLLLRSAQAAASAQALVFHPSSGQLLFSLWALSRCMCALGLSSGATSSWKPSQTSLPLKSGLNTPPLGSDSPLPLPPCHPVDLSGRGSSWTVNAWVLCFSH